MACDLAGAPTTLVAMDDGARIAVWDSGGAGAPVVLVHGFPENRMCWRPALSALAGLEPGGRRFVAYDLRGHGRSAAAGEASLARYHADHQAIVAALGLERHHLVGHDWGGAIVLHAARFAPESIHTVAVLNANYFKNDPSAPPRNGLHELGWDAPPLLDCIRASANGVPERACRSDRVFGFQFPTPVDRKLA